MTLFRNNPIRSAATAAVVVSVAHFSTRFLSSLHAFQLTQTSIAILSIAALLFMIMMHHRMDGQMLTRSQEEMATIGIFALFWIVVLVSYRSFAGQSGGKSVADLVVPKASQDTKSASGSYNYWEDPCSRGDTYCVYEEYTYF
ncbi:hypothetical protein CPC08DRAFT_702004 [Agrocybe pediades]|nr:hypothetical protein CPC08DRAFT_702004 [Agrocybe pediades]